jgi:hypothetical protein
MQALFPGDRVAFHEDFIRDHPGRRREAAIGIVKAVRGDRAKIDWDLDGLPRVVNVGNLVKVGEGRHP